MGKKSLGIMATAFLSASTIVAGASFTTPLQVHAATVQTENETVKWLTIHQNSRTVTLRVIADDSGDNGGMNLDGYSNGALNVEVPQGWVVKVSFQNHSEMMPHSLMIVPYAQRSKIYGFTTAFQGSSTPQPSSGVMKGSTQSFHFKANRGGIYAMICGIPGHSSHGMWDKFTVSSKLKSPVALVTPSSQGSSGYDW